jgi:steroid 5-alpha reductase family enzyme
MIFFVQSVFQPLINAPALFLSIWSTDGIEEPQFIAGLILAICGLLFETVADIQLSLFKKDPKNKGVVLTRGLWRDSRHPNYFGEACFWWGIYVMACSFERGWITFFGPLILTLLVRYVSGVPILEKNFAKRPGFKRYERETNTFFPWFPKVWDGKDEDEGQEVPGT